MGSFNDGKMHEKQDTYRLWMHGRNKETRISDNFYVADWYNTEQSNTPDTADMKYFSANRTRFVGRKAATDRATKIKRLKASGSISRDSRKPVRHCAASCSCARSCKHLITSTSYTVPDSNTHKKARWRIITALGFDILLLLIGMV